MKGKFTAGFDFGTLSCRACLADTMTGDIIATASCPYPHGVMSESLNGHSLPDGFALEDPADYIFAFTSTVRDLFFKSGVSSTDIAGIGIDFTMSTVLPVYADGRPLVFDSKFAQNPHAYAKLWKHHAAQRYADIITAESIKSCPGLLDRVGGKCGCEGLSAKIWETLDNAPEVYAAADYYIEAGDWMVMLLTGRLTRGVGAAVTKALFTRELVPPTDFFFKLDPRFADIDKKLAGDLLFPGSCAGHVREESARIFNADPESWFAPGTEVAVFMADGHAAVAGNGTIDEGCLVASIGTSAAYMIFGREEKYIPGICGCTYGAAIPGLYMYSSGLSCAGDLLGWYADRFTPPEYAKEAAENGETNIGLLTRKAATLCPGESGLIALGWVNGNKSMLQDTDLSGMIIGLTLRSKPEEIWRAFAESLAFGTRVIIESHKSAGIPVKKFIALGGIAEKSPFLMQMFADVLGMEIEISPLAQYPGYSIAVYAAVAAGIYPTVPDACTVMKHTPSAKYIPDNKRGEIYSRLYAEYLKLYDYFGRGENDVMKKLRRIEKTEN